MIRSILLYSRFLFLSLFREGGDLFIADLARYGYGRRIYGRIPDYTGPELKDALDAAISWLNHASRVSNDGGIGSYHLIDGWSSSYPETTGYIIPTLLGYSRRFGSESAVESADRAGKFLLAIQKDSGGWQGGRITDNRPEIVFNTGQVIRGMLALHASGGDDRYLHAAAKAGDWLCSIQQPEGCWKRFALMEQERVYDTYVDVPLLMLWKVTGKEEYLGAAIRNLDWVVDARMNANGWFNDCDNTVRHNDRPILHTIAYTLDGLTDASELTGNEKYFKAASRGASVLRDLFLRNGYLNGRYDERWNGSEYFICTGGAQMAVVWMKHYRLSGEEAFMEAADRMANLLVFIQNRREREKENTLGALSGSFPLWGRYEPFNLPNWATKYLADALMMRLEMDGKYTP